MDTSEHKLQMIDELQEIGHDPVELLNMSDEEFRELYDGEFNNPDVNTGDLYRNGKFVGRVDNSGRLIK